MNPSDRVCEVLPQCVETCTELARQLATTNHYAPTKEEFAADLEADRFHKLAILVEAYASAILMVLDEEHIARRRDSNAIWDKLREMNGGPFPGDL